MNWVKSGKEKSENENVLNCRDRVVRDGGGERPGMPNELLP